MLTRDELLDKMVQEITGALSVHFKTFLKEATRTCINCASWSEDGDFCTKYNQKPPGKIIVSGCEQHTERELKWQK